MTGDLPAPRVRKLWYWLDLLAAAGLGWALFFTSTRVGVGGPVYLAATAGAILALLRALVFLHEIAHRRGGPWFEAAWNVAAGIPMGVPSLMYVGSHLDHHRVDRFATRADPEYAPIAGWGRARRIAFVLGGALVPVLLVLRWGLLAPAGLVWRRARAIVVSRCSTLAINPAYARAPAPASRSDRLRWRILEPAAAAWVWIAGAGVLTADIGARVAAQWLLVVGGVFALNQLRTLVAHGYAGFGSPVDLDGQLRDSINLASGAWAALVAPLGLRYHALHHLRPDIPYHDLGRVHRELLAALPAESPYRRAGSATIARAFGASAAAAR
jgi:fatty acid desaturase